MAETLRPLRMHEAFNGKGILEIWEGTFTHLFTPDTFQEITKEYAKMEIEIPQEAKSFMDRYSNRILDLFSGLPKFLANANGADENQTAFGAVKSDAPKEVSGAFSDLVKDGKGAHSQLNNEISEGRFLEGVRNLVKYLIIPLQQAKVEELAEKQKRIKEGANTLAATDISNTENLDVVVNESNIDFANASETVEEEEAQLNLLLNTWIELLKKIDDSMEILSGFFGSRLKIDLDPAKQATINTSLPMTA